MFYFENKPINGLDEECAGSPICFDITHLHASLFFQEAKQLKALEICLEIIVFFSIINNEVDLGFKIRCTH